MSEVRAFAYRERASQAHKKAMRDGIPEETRRAWLIVGGTGPGWLSGKRPSWARRCLGIPGRTQQNDQANLITLCTASRSIFRILRGMERNCSSARFSRHGQKHHNGNVTWSCVARSWWIGWVHYRSAARTDDTDDSWVWYSDYGVSARGQRCVSSFAPK